MGAIEQVAGRVALTVVVIYGAALAALALAGLLGPLLAGLLQRTRPSTWLKRVVQGHAGAPGSDLVWSGGYTHGFMLGFWLMLWFGGAACLTIAVWHPTWHPVWSLLSGD